MIQRYRTSAESRERNRMHARKTRQRKKEHMMNLQNRADNLKREQLRIRQVINEKTTASILVGLFSINNGNSISSEAEDPKIEELLQRPLDSIPDASKIPELPALILPGQHNSRKQKIASSLLSSTSRSDGSKQCLPDDGIDYKLLGKDRSKCTPAELDQIRRERNRMHAERTRDRKRLFMEEMEEVIKKLEEENSLLKNHLNTIGGELSTVSSASPPHLVSPKIQAALSPPDEKSEVITQCSGSTAENTLLESPQPKQKFVTQLKSLLVAAGIENDTTKSSVATVTTAVSSANVSGNSSFCEDASAIRAMKRQRVETGIPHSITTSTTLKGS